MAYRSGEVVRRAGAGEVVVRDFGQSGSKISALGSSYPLRLISPRSAPSSRAVLVFVLTYGGGIVAGDETDLRVQILENARLGLLTQGSTKVYKSPSSEICTRQRLTAQIEDGGALLLLPDPVQPFADSVYEQRQVFEMDHTRSSLLLLDWVCEGRGARGESWSFTRWRSSNEIWSLSERANKPEDFGQRLLLRDNIKLDRRSSASAIPLQERMEGMGVFGTLIITGPIFKALGDFFLHAYASRPRIGEKNWTSKGANGTTQQDAAQTLEHSLELGLTWTATSTRQFVIVRFGVNSVDHAKRWLREMLIQDGTVETEFGRQYLHCLQDR